MPIPDYQTVMLPLLKLVNSQGPLDMNRAVSMLADHFNLTETERRALLPSGRKSPIIKNRVGWARTYLKKAGLLAYPQRGLFEITERGKKVLADNPSVINIAFLRQFPEFLDFINSSRETVGIESKTIIDVSQGTPEEILEGAYSQLKNQMIAEIIEKIRTGTPQFFENLVVDTMVKIGYGGSRKDAGRAIGRSGDEGVDGIINEDRLGLDVIYLQAKKWEGNVSRPEVQKFAGALQGKRAKKGIFITSSDFTNEAREYVKNIELKIILISGRQLAELMWEHNVGVEVAVSYDVKKIDFDYFAD